MGDAFPEVFGDRGVDVLKTLTRFDHIESTQRAEIPQDGTVEECWETGCDGTPGKVAPLREEANERGTDSRHARSRKHQQKEN